MKDDSFVPRLIALTVTGIILVVLSSTLFSWWAVGPLRLRPLIVVIVSAGFSLPLLWGGLLTFLFGFFDDLLSGGFLGLHILSYMIVFCMCALAERKLQIYSWPLQMASVAVMSLLLQVFLVSFMALIRWEHLLPLNLPFVLLSQSLLNALTAPLFFSIIDWFSSIISSFSPKTGARSL